MVIIDVHIVHNWLADLGTQLLLFIAHAATGGRMGNLQCQLHTYIHFQCATNPPPLPTAESRQFLIRHNFSVQNRRVMRAKGGRNDPLLGDSYLKAPEVN